MSLFLMDIHIFNMYVLRNHIPSNGFSVLIYSEFIANMQLEKYIGD